MVFLYVSWWLSLHHTPPCGHEDCAELDGLGIRQVIVLVDPVELGPRAGVSCPLVNWDMLYIGVDV